MMSASLSTFLHSSPMESRQPAVFLPLSSQQKIKRSDTGRSGREQPAGGADVRAGCQDKSGAYQGCVYKAVRECEARGRWPEGDLPHHHCHHHI